MYITEIVDGKLIGEYQNPAVTTCLLTEIWKWMQEGSSYVDVVCRLRQRTVPRGYQYQEWKKGQNVCMCMHTHLKLYNVGESETPADMMRSVLAQLEYCHEICEWDRKGVPFRTHIYVPEVHPLTNLPFCEMEDEPHVLKVIMAYITMYIHLYVT